MNGLPQTAWQWYRENYKWVLAVAFAYFVGWFQAVVMLP